MSRPLTRFCVCLLTLALLSVWIAACSSPAPASPAAAPTAAAGAKAPQAAPPAPAAPVELKMSVYVPETHHIYTEIMQPFGKELEDKSAGRLTVKAFTGETLVKAADTYDAVVKGIADLGFGIPNYTPGRFPLSTVGELPFVAPSGVVGSAIAYSLLDGTLQKEYPDAKVVGMATTSPFQLLTVSKKVRTLEDLAGLKIRTPGGGATDWLKKLGATPVTIAAPELYMALKQGVVDGALFPFGPAKDRKFQEVVKNVAVVNIGATVIIVPVNLDTWNKLPADVQKVVSDAGTKFSLQLAGQSYDRQDQESMKIFKEAGVDIYQMPPTEMNRWQEKLLPLWDEWVTQMDQKGLPGKDTMAAFRAARQKQGLQ